MEQVVQPFISIDVDARKVAPLCEKLSEVFKSHGVQVESNRDNLHVSLAYVNGSCEKARLAEIAKKIAEHKFNVRVIGVEIFEGQATEFDYVALSFETENEFAVASREIANELSTKSFNDGFRTHLTLFKIRKNDCKRELMKQICSVLLPSEVPLVCGQAVSVFSSDYQRQLTVTI